jgi:alkanesulfonate monooxygenase SsuD/methylene tetrahydromethanopterin reductase-like flavin-dependent oxidoreductase (luciferase family)
VLDPDRTERPILPQAPPVVGGPTSIAEHLRELADAGADEAILVVSPIDEASIWQLGEVIAAR